MPLSDVIKEIFGCTDCGSADSAIEIAVNITIQLNTAYALEVEIIRTDTNRDVENADIFIDGQKLGTCSPNGSDAECTYFHCSQMSFGYNVPISTVSSKTGTIKLRVQYSNEVGNDLTCTSNGITAAGISRVTLKRGKTSILCSYYKY